jgi:hypothetical protein
VKKSNSKRLILVNVTQKYLIRRFKVCKSEHHRTIQIDHQPDVTTFQFNYPGVYLQLNPPIIRNSTTAVAATVLLSYRGDNRAVFVVGPAQPRPTALLPPRYEGKTRGCYCSR